MLIRENCIQIFGGHVLYSHDLNDFHAVVFIREKIE